MPEQTPSTETPASLRAIENALVRGRAELPALATLLDAFGPLLAAQARVRAAAPGWDASGGEPLADAERYCQGVFLLADSGFQDMSPELPAAAKTLLPVMAAAFPALAAELSALGQALESGALDPKSLASAAFGETPDVPGVGEQALVFAATELVRPFLQRQAEDLQARVKDLPWRQPFCPVCGSAPNMSVLRRMEEDDEFIKSHGGRRFLRCSCCAAEWTHKRVSCPVCGCEEPDELLVLRDPERQHERADVCKRCKSFVLCLDGGDLVEMPDPDVAALTMLPLFIQTRKQGYAPMGLHPWSEL